jgi:zinc transport system permease protein
MAELLALEFFRNAVLAAALASVLCGVVGTLVVLKRLVSISGGVAHAAFGGLGAAYHYGVDPRLGAAAVALVAAAGLGALDGERARRQDAAIGVLWALGMAVGLVFLHLTPGYAPNLMGFLFGDILTVRRSDLAIAVAAVAVVLVLFAALREELVAVAFDEENARLQGIPVRLFGTLLLALVGLSVVVLLQLVGIVLAVALLTIPPLTALRLARSLQGVVATSILAGLVATEGGLAAAYALDLPAGPVMVLLAAALLGASRLFPPRTRRARAAGGVA